MISLFQQQFGKVRAVLPRDTGRQRSLHGGYSARTADARRQALISGRLKLGGGLIDRLAGTRLPGACANVLEMKTKARRLIEGDRALAEAIRSNQARVLETFAPEVVKRQWAAALFGGAQSY